MKRSFLTLLFLASFSMYLIYAQSNIDSTNETQIWKIFASGVCDFNTFETGEIKQNFIDVKQVGNKFYWGEDNVFTIYNKKEKHSGFMSITTYDFIDKFKQRGVMIYSLSFVLAGYNIFASAFFTALNNGVVSAAISFLRTLVFQVTAVLTLPLWLDVDGIWLSIVAAEGMAILVSGILFVKMRNRYGY